MGIRVRIDGVEIPCDDTQPTILSGLTVTWGREDRLARPNASTCDFEITDSSTEGAYVKTVQFNSVVDVVATRPDGGADIRVFRGRVSDISLTRSAAGEILLQCTAVDPTAALNSTTVGAAPWPQESQGARRSRILSAIGGSTAFYWPTIPPNGSNRTFTMAAKDVDSQSAYDLVSDFLWGIAVAAWPIDASSMTTFTTTLPGIVQTPQLGLGVLKDTRANRRVPVGQFENMYGNDTEVTYVSTVCLDSCDIDLEALEWRANPADTRQTVRVTYGESTDAAGVVVSPPAGDYDPTRVFDVTSGVFNNSDATGVAAVFLNQHMAGWKGEFYAPWAVGALTIDPDIISGIDDFHLAMVEMLDQQKRPDHVVMIQQMPHWVPWRWLSGGTGDRWMDNVIVLLEGGVYSYTDGRWLLSVNLSTFRPLYAALAPPGTITVRPGDTVYVDHDDPQVRPDPTTTWDVGLTALFNDGRYGWDGTRWVGGGTRAINVTPGSRVYVPPTDIRVRPNPANPAPSWARYGEWATFSTGTFRWSGTAWLSVVVVLPGSTQTIAHTNSAVMPEPVTPWGQFQYATFTDGTWRWTGSAWTAVVVVKPGTTTTRAHTDPAIVPSPTLAWASTDYATFSDGTYGWNGKAWVTVIPPVVVTPFSTVAVPHTDSRVVPNPSNTAWYIPTATGSSRPYSYATFTDGQWGWNSVTWVRVYPTRPGDVVTTSVLLQVLSPTPWETAWTQGQYMTLRTTSYRWSGTAWVVWTPVTVTPGSTVNIAHNDPTAMPSPSTAWADDQYATFTDGKYRWDGTAWVALITPVPVAPGDVVPLRHDDPAVVPNPTTPWEPGQFAQFTDGAFAWNGTAWVAKNTDTAWQAAPAGIAWEDVPTGMSWVEWTGDL